VLAPHGITRREAAQELLDRLDAEEHLLPFVRAVRPGYEVGEHHKAICDVLEQVERGEVDRVIIEAPPRHGKSEIVSVHYPAWLVGRNPSWHIMAVSYADDLAVSFGRRVRNIVASSDYTRIFEHTTLAPDSKAANSWHTMSGGAYTAAGIGGALTGKGARVLIIDDPFKNREEADSERRRDYVWNIFTSDLQSRLMPGGAIIVMHTRWHEDDLVGRIEERAKREGGDRYKKVTLKAIENEGTDYEKALWPEWYPLEALRRIRSNTPRRSWVSLYQQDPHPEGGDYFQQSWFRRFNMGAQPERLNFYISSDYAVSEKTKTNEPDFTEHAVWGIDAHDNMWLVDWWFGQTASDVWIDKALDFQDKHKAYAVFGEAGVIEKAVAPIFKARINERKIYPYLNFIPSTQDKPARARAFQARASLGKVFIPNCDFGDRLIAQLVKFPNGKHDDAVDACSIMANALDATHPAITPVTDTTPKKRNYWQEAEQRSTGPSSWRV
jgi:predicted phage terminase large subunit-like protein